MKADAPAARARIDAKVVFILIYYLVLCEYNCIGKKRCETILQLKKSGKIPGKLNSCSGRHAKNLFGWSKSARTRRKEGSCLKC